MANMLVAASGVAKHRKSSGVGTDGDPFIPEVKASAGELHLGSVSGTTYVHEVTLSLDTNAYADGDVLADTQEIASAVRVAAGAGVLHSVAVLDKDDQGEALDIVFLKTDVSLGTENAAVSISDADADEILCIVEVAAGDYVDLINSQLATKSSVGVGVKAAAAATSLFVGAISRGTGTYTAAGITLKITILAE